MAKLDPSAALQRQPLSAVAGPIAFTAPYQPASVWLRALLADPRRLPWELGVSAAELVPSLVSGAVTARHMDDAAHGLIESATGFRWWEAVKLVGMSCSHQVLGELTLCGVDPDKVSLGQWCAATYQVFLRNADDKQRTRLDFELSIPPEGYEESWEDDEDYYARMMADAAKNYRG